MNETVGGSDVVENVIELDIKVVRERWGWFMALGILMIVLGMIAIGGPLASGIAVSLLVGWLLVISGVAHGIHAFQSSGWRGGLVQFLCGLLYLGVGGMMITNPIAGLLALTVTVLVYFVVSGIFKIILAIRVEHLPATRLGDSQRHSVVGAGDLPRKPVSHQRLVGNRDAVWNRNDIQRLVIRDDRPGRAQWG